MMAGRSPQGCPRCLLASPETVLLSPGAGHPAQVSVRAPVGVYGRGLCFCPEILESASLLSLTSCPFWSSGLCSITGAPGCWETFSHILPTRLYHVRLRMWLLCPPEVCAFLPAPSPCWLPWILTRLPQKSFSLSDCTQGKKDLTSALWPFPKLVESLSLLLTSPWLLLRFTWGLVNEELWGPPQSWPVSCPLLCSCLPLLLPF